MIKKERVKFILQYLNKKYPKTPVPLNNKNKFELLVAVLLSAQCTDKRVNEVTPELFSIANNARNMKLIDESKKKLEFVSDEQIDTFYKVSTNEIKVPYIKKGIYDVLLTLYPDVKVQMPLENIFKQLHCTDEIPFIKYKPGFKKEELYRLYSSGFSVNGSKIPYLSKSQIVNFSKHSVSSSNYICLVVQKKMELENVNIFYSFLHNVNI